MVRDTEKTAPPPVAPGDGAQNTERETHPASATRIVGFSSEEGNAR